MQESMTQKQKNTAILFDEKEDWITVQTHNTSLKHRLTAYARKYPKECRKTAEDKHGALTFAIRKGRLSIRLTAPYSKERRQKSSEQGRQHMENLKGVQK